MDHQGERRNPVFKLENNQIEDLVEHIWKEVDLRSVSLLSGGYSNTNYLLKIEKGPGPCVLRLFPEKDDRAKIEVALLKKYQSLLPMPQVLFEDFSRTIIPYSYGIYSWIEGVALNQVFPTLTPIQLESLGQQLGQSLAKIHKIQLPKMGLLNSSLDVDPSFKNPWDFFFPFIEERLTKGKARSRLGEGLSHQLFQLVEDNADLIHQIKNYCCLVHGDFNGKNLIVRKYKNEWEFAAVIDWEFALSCTPLFDFGNLFRYDVGFPTEFENGVCSGYQRAGGHLPQSWKKIAKLLDLINLCDFMNGKSEKPILFRDSRNLIENTLINWSGF